MKSSPSWKQGAKRHHVNRQYTPNMGKLCYRQYDKTAMLTVFFGN